MKTPVNIRKHFCYFVLMAAVLMFALSYVASHTRWGTLDDTEDVSRKLAGRMNRLAEYGGRILYSPESEADWPELPGFPDDMVLYKYVDGRLHSWYNVLTVNNDDLKTTSLNPPIVDGRFDRSSPLSRVGAVPSFVNYGPNWYLVESVSEDNVTIIEALLLKGVDKAGGSVWMNGKLIRGNDYDFAPLSCEEGEAVCLDGVPMFKLVDSGGSLYVLSLPAVHLRWISLTLLALSFVLYLNDKKSWWRCVVAIAAIIGTALFARSQTFKLEGLADIFSPSLCSLWGGINSLGVLFIFDIAIFLAVLCLYLCRKEIAARFRGGRMSVVPLSVMLVSTGLLLFYIFHTFISIVENPGIMMELYKIKFLSVTSVMVYLSYALLFIAILLCIETCMEFAGHSDRHTILSPLPIFFAAFVLAGIFSVLAAWIGFKNECKGINAYVERYSYGRNARVENELKEIEASIDAEPAIRSLLYADGGELILRRVFEDRYLDIRSAGEATLRVEWNQKEVNSLARELLGRGQPITENSHFYFLPSDYRSRYVGLFSYFDKENGVATIILDVVPDVMGDPSLDKLQNNYSLARYKQRKLVSFRGNFPYPTALGDIREKKLDRESNSYISEGYRHFVRPLPDGDMLIVSRRTVGPMMYALSFIYIAFLLLVSMPFRKKDRDGETAGSFSRKIRVLTETSLLATLIIIVFFSVTFVYNANKKNLMTMMSTRISTVQMLLDRTCAGMSSCEQMRSKEFLEELGRISRSTVTRINIFAPGGELFLTGEKGLYSKVTTPGRLQEEVYRELHFNHKRYYIYRDVLSSLKQYALYAPIICETGSIIGIAEVPYVEKDTDLVYDAVFHGAAIISIFVILLFFTLVMSSSMTAAIFRPLVNMGRKMHANDINSLETIEYDGRDEVSVLVEAYNRMVAVLRESSGRHAAMERDKAWSEMARQIAHEIKNPLTPIKLEIQRLVRLRQKNDPGWEQKFDSVAGIVLEHIDILANTANDFSTFAKLYSEPSVEMNLDSVLKDQIMLFESNERLKITYLGTPDAIISGPKPQLIRVIVNILTNAVQATEDLEEPMVLVSLRRPAGLPQDSRIVWEISVEDNGPGVAPENTDKLFIPNFTTKSSGTGLGLAMCRNIVEKCGGTIVYSKSFNMGGACFTVQLPAEC